ncbi:KamA family radical SAM protein [Marinilabilia rubra]|uniref:Lysine 2,3-aminomutase n=1 Tax=Marinilabilia rubra TaxID=2162893 RepID=A0A2U2BEG9_9BACT|nr:lysine 2,3-aminomutase [Marinilabilia rubra]PWE01459.1 lysine 2,3-aminomutase [Marinilabilia rubra]
MKYQIYSLHNYRNIPQIDKLNEQDLRNIDVVGHVLPFKTNNYVVNELIDWDNFHEDPIFILNFPQKQMLHPEDFDNMSSVLDKQTDKVVLKKAANEIRHKLNPHPAGQAQNVPELNGQKLPGIQHKYDETMLFFPTQGQTCHAYCTFCFRWPQFTGMDDLKFAMNQVEYVIEYLKVHPEISDILITGGDPMVMKASILDAYITKILDADIPHLQNIRIGSKSLSFWPYRYLTDNDADDILRIFEKVTKAGKSLAFMAHFNHHRELETEAVSKAVERIRQTGAQIRTQSPILNHINADSNVWSTMWKKQVNMGMIPYYMFVARDTGAQEYFGVSLSRAWDIFRNAYINVSGISRTVRGPSMSCTPGKVRIIGVSQVRGEKVFVCEFIQGRNREWVGYPFFAKYDPKALWMDDLKPAFGEKEFFFEEDLARLLL